MPTTAKQLVEAANAAVPKISGKEAQEMVAKGAVLIDIRDSAELTATGKAAGALHIPRGSLEFKADPTSPTAEKSLSTDKTVILHCAVRRTRGARGQAAQGYGLREGLQPRRLQGLGRGRRQGREVIREGRSRAACRRVR